MSDLITSMLFSLVGGLGIFLLGMKQMQQGLQVVAGPRIKQMIHAVTSNRFLAVGIGVVITMLVQSSSVTTVMVVGLVNSTLMTLSSAIGVIMGANIGTTITGWILVLKIGKYGLPILGVCAFLWLFLKPEKLRYTALAIMGIGMIFFGLELMKDGFKPLKDLPEFTEAFKLFAATNYAGVLKAALVGCVLTVIVQSSSATLGITIGLAEAGLIDFPTAGALVLGENIGTTITAFLASLGADDMNAKRAAYFHILFNVIGVLWITFIYLPIYLPLLESFLPNAPGMLIDGEYTHMREAIATVHTIFNVANVIIFLPFVQFFANFLTRFITGKEREREYLTHLEFKIGDSAVVALEQSGSEIRRSDAHVRKMLDNLETVITEGGENNKTIISSIFEREDILDNVQIEITGFLTDLLADSLSHEDAETARNQLRLIDEYESLSDYVTSILKLHLRLREHNEQFAEAQFQELMELHHRVAKYYDLVRRGFDGDARRQPYLDEVRRQSRDTTVLIRELRNRHWTRLSAEKFTPLISTSYMDIMNSYRRLKDHLLNVAEATVGGKSLSEKWPEEEKV